MFALVDQWKASGATQKSFCAEQQINIHTFSYWVARHKQTQQPSGGFTAIDLNGTGEAEQLTIIYPNGVRISLAGAPLPLISQLIRLG